MKHCNLFFLIAVIVLAASDAARAQGSWDNYAVRSLSEAIASHETPTADMQKLYAVENLPSRMRVTYTGAIRPLSAQRRAFIQAYFHDVRQRPQYASLFQREILVREGVASYWLPLQDQLVSYLEREVQKGDVIDLFTMYVGGVRTGKKIDWLFLVNEFETSPQVSAR